MSDVVQRLRDGLEAGAIDLADIMDAADEIERLRNGAVSGCETVPDPDSTTLETHPIQRQPTLTDAEREALYWFTGGLFPVCPQHLATIRGLMVRLS